MLKSARTYVDTWFMPNRLIDFPYIVYTLIRAHPCSCVDVSFFDFSFSHSCTHTHAHMQENSCISISKMVCTFIGTFALPYCKWNDCTFWPQNNVAAQKRATTVTKRAPSAIYDVYLWITYARAFLVVAFFRPFAIQTKRFYGSTKSQLTVHFLWLKLNGALGCVYTYVVREKKQ